MSSYDTDALLDSHGLSKDTIVEKTYGVSSLKKTEDLQLFIPSILFDLILVI